MHKDSILVYNVSDETLNIFKEKLESEYELICTFSETEAFSIIEKNIVKLVLSEYDKVLNQSLNQFINSKNTFIPLICFAGKINVSTEVEILNSGVDSVIKEPYNTELIKIKVDNYVKTKTLSDNANSEMKQKREEIEKSRNTIIIAMSILAESRDNYTGEHLIRMQGVTKIIANKYKELYSNDITDKEVDEIVLFAPLHDIGKIPIPDTVLKNTGKYSQEDMEIMKDHTILGGELLLKTQEQLNEDSNFLKTAIEIATYHHEKYDGTGYPYGLKGENIPLSARIVSLADVYDAIISPRLYKEGFSHNSVVEIILHGDGRIAPEQFDPKVLYAFNQSLQDIQKLYK